MSRRASISIDRRSNPGGYDRCSGRGNHTINLNSYATIDGFTINNGGNGAYYAVNLAGSNATASNNNITYSGGSSNGRGGLCSGRRRLMQICRTIRISGTGGKS